MMTEARSEQAFSRGVTRRQILAQVPPAVHYSPLAWCFLTSPLRALTIGTERVAPSWNGRCSAASQERAAIGGSLLVRANHI